MKGTINRKNSCTFKESSAVLNKCTCSFGLRIAISRCVFHFGLQLSSKVSSIQFPSQSNQALHFLDDELVLLPKFPLYCYENVLTLREEYRNTPGKHQPKFHNYQCMNNLFRNFSVLGIKLTLAHPANQFIQIPNPKASHHSNLLFSTDKRFIKNK